MDARSLEINVGKLASNINSRRTHDPEGSVHAAKVELDNAVRANVISHNCRMDLERILDTALSTLQRV